MIIRVHTIVRLFRRSRGNRSRRIQVIGMMAAETFRIPMMTYMIGDETLSNDMYASGLMTRCGAGCADERLAASCSSTGGVVLTSRCFGDDTSAGDGTTLGLRRTAAYNVSPAAMPK